MKATLWMAVRMVKSAIDRSEQGHLVELFTALQAAVRNDADAHLADPVTFWRHQLLVGVEPSQLPELLELLDAVTAMPGGGDVHLRARARHWHEVLEPRTPRAQPWRPRQDGGHS
jgi:hypothetical protein